MNLTYYGCNSFLIEAEERVLILDPGVGVRLGRLRSLVPRPRWSEANIVLVTHGDFDHARYVESIARTSGAPIVCGTALAERWERAGLAVVPVGPGEETTVDGLPIRGVEVEHGPRLRAFGREKRISLTSVGAIGLLVTLGPWSLLALGDTLLVEDAWRGLRPDVVLVPIGGIMTMDVDAALRAIDVLQPRIAIPVHYHWRTLLHLRPADAERFADKARLAGCQCLQLAGGESVYLQHNLTL